MNNHDVKQLIVAKEEISLFKVKKIDLCRLFSLLSVHGESLENVDNDVIEKLQSWVNKLERFFYEKIEKFEIEDRENKMSNILYDMESYLDLLINKYCSIPDQDTQDRMMLIDDNLMLCPKCNNIQENIVTTAMIYCANCKSILHNPFYKNLNR